MQVLFDGLPIDDRNYLGNSWEANSHIHSVTPSFGPHSEEVVEAVEGAGDALCHVT